MDEMKEILRKKFSKNLRYYLDFRDKTQADLARAMKVSTATTSDWCNGKQLPRIDKMEDICNWLNIDFWDLYPKDSAPNPDVMLITNDEEKEIIKHYRLAEEGIKSSVRKLLDVKDAKDGRVWVSVS